MPLPPEMLDDGDSGSGGGGGIRRLVAENPVVVVGQRGCCMVHVLKCLLMGHGVKAAVCEVGEDADVEVLMGGELAGTFSSSAGAAGVAQQRRLLPAVFIGGRLVGGVERLMAVHISGDLAPILRESGALWL